MNKTRFLTAGFFGIVFLLSAGETVIDRNRDSADRANITRWYVWGKKTDPKIKKYERCEGWLEYDFELKEGGWYEFWQKGCPPEWGHIVYFDDKPVLDETRISYSKLNGAIEDKTRYGKDFSIYLEPGKHTLKFRRETFPGAFASWQLRKADPIAEKRIRTRWSNNVVRAKENPILLVNAGSDVASNYSFVLKQHGTGKIFDGVKYAIPVMKKPKTFEVKFPNLPEGVYTLQFAPKDGVEYFQGDLAAENLIVIDSTPAPAPAELKRTLVVDINCAKTAPYREKDGTTKVVKASFGSYRESSGNASEPHWGLDGFSYQAQLPDITHVYQLVVDYPDDDLRSTGFWVNDGSDLRKGGVCLTGGVETGGAYRLTNSIKTHESFFYPRNKDLVIAVLNLNHGTKAAASRIRIYRIDDHFPAAKTGMRRGRLAGFFFEENGRWDRFFGLGHGDPKENPYKNLSSLRTMERWAEWNRFCGQNLMSPTVLAYGGIEYPSKKISGFSMRFIHAPRMLALVAEKYGQKFLPHMVFHGEAKFDNQMGVKYKNVPDPKHPGREKTIYELTRPEVIEWSKTGSSVIPWRRYSYNPLHPDVQKYVIDGVGELADSLADSPAFLGISIRVPLAWQFYGVTGLNSADYGYGDWNIAQFEKDTGIKVPGRAGDPKRFMERYKFLMGQHEKTWLKWRHDRILAYYKAIRDRVRKANPKAEVFFMWWPNNNGRTLARQLKESGISPEDMKSEPDFSFYGMQVMYGRRYFTPAGAMKREARLYDSSTYDMSRTGHRPVCIYSEYYEVNDHLKWEELGARKYCAFDALAPSGVNELRSYAIPLAKADVATFINGGNGWIFGTPSLTAPFMREFLALPTDKFEPAQGINADPVAVHVLRNKEGFFFYTINQSDLTVKVKMDVKGKLLSAADGTKVSSDFELSGYGLRSFLIKDADAKLISVKVSYPDSERQRIGKLMDFAKEMKYKLETNRIGMEQPLDRHNAALRRLDHALKTFAEGGIAEAYQDLSSAEIVEIFDHSGEYPENFMEAKSQIGGFPKNSPKMPKLEFMKVYGGNPLDFPGPVVEYKAPDGRRYAAVSLLNESARLMAFDKNGKLTAAAMIGNSCKEQPGDIRHPQQSARSYRPVWGIRLNGDDLILNIQRTAYAFDPVTLRQKEMDPRVTIVPEIRKQFTPEFPEKRKSGNLLSPTKLKVHNGKIWFISDNYLRSLDPKTGTVQDELKLRPAQWSFAFDKSGNLYTAAHNYNRERGTGFDFYAWKDGKFSEKPEQLNNGKLVVKHNYTMPTDLDVSDDGILYRANPRNNEFKYWKDGKKTNAFIMGGCTTHEQDYSFGFLRDPDGTLYVAGGSSRNLRCYAPDGSLRWERKFIQYQTGNSLPIRSLSAVAKDSAGRLWAADQYGDRILCFDSKTGEYLGKFGYFGTMLDEAEGRFHGITGLAVLDDVLYVADFGNNRIVSYKIVK